MFLLSAISLTGIILTFGNEVGLSKGCVELTGIGDGADDIFTIDDLSDLPIGQLFIQSFTTFIPVYGNHDDLYETAIQFRQGTLSMIQLYNTLAAYEETALDFFAREDITLERRRCQPYDNETSELFTLHRSVAYAYALYYLYQYRKPTTLDPYATLFESWGLIADICDTGDIDCSDPDLISTPWGLAYVIVNEIEFWKTNDGWNEFGALNRDYNRIPFSDFRDSDTAYTPVNTPWELSDEFIDRWQPLLETDNYGFLFYQEHVLPHIGYTAKSFVYSNDEFCDRDGAYDPNYNYTYEIETTINNLANNLDDKTKMEIELFDAKLSSLLPLTGQFYRRTGFDLDSMEFNAANLIQHVALYEGAIAVWKEKVDFDKVRPPSIIHKILDEQLITSYAGTTPDGETQGTQTFPANNWEPYIRTMPHAEYPSASACVCQAWADALSIHTGTTDVTGTIGGPFVLRRAAFSSRYEPLSTPSEDVLFFYSSWQQVSDRCGDSRIEGGMHFSEAVPAGQDLCNDIGAKAADYVGKLLNGEVPDFVVDFYDTAVVERDCYPESDDDSKDKKSKSDSNSESKSKSSSESESESKD